MNIAIDVGKYQSYVVMKDENGVIREGSVKTSRQGFDEFFLGVCNANIVVEASSTLKRVVSLLQKYNSKVVVANPRHVKIISKSIKKTDKNDAHTLLDLYERDYLPESYLPDKETAYAREVCHLHNILIQERTRIKNRIRGSAYDNGIDFKTFNKKSLKELSNSTFQIKLLCEALINVNEKVRQVDEEIERVFETNHYAKLLYTIPGIGKYGALGIAAQIGDIKRFSTEDKLFSYAGLVPITHQSGQKEWKGHIGVGDKFLKYLLVQCVQIHINMSTDSNITKSFKEIRERRGYGRAKIAAARKLLRVIYWMLMRNSEYVQN